MNYFQRAAKHCRIRGLGGRIIRDEAENSGSQKSLKFRRGTVGFMKAGDTKAQGGKVAHLEVTK